MSRSSPNTVTPVDAVTPLTVWRRVSIAFILVAIIGGLLIFALFPRTSTGAAGQCSGRTGAVAVGQRYPLAIPVQGDTVLSNVDFDGRLWQAAGDRVSTNGLAPPGATTLDGAATLVNREQATFSSPAAFATLLPLTKVDGCGARPVVRTGSALVGG